MSNVEQNYFYWNSLTVWKNWIIGIKQQNLEALNRVQMNMLRWLELLVK